MRVSIITAITAAAVLTAGSAFAQSAPAADTAVNPPAAVQDGTAAPAEGFTSSSTLGDTSKLKAGDPNVVSNAPVPDTHENRAKYGRPLSQTGRRTAATGD
jgi:hypothetical protein